MIPLKDVSKVHKFIEPKNGMGVPSGWEEGKWDFLITGIVSIKPGGAALELCPVALHLDATIMEHMLTF